MRVLIIDDSRTMRHILSDIMCGLGFEAVEAEDGVQAMAALEAGPPFDVALVDWNMPNMNGIEFVHAVRSNPAYARTLLMMVTTEATMESVVEALDAGADEYVMKPFTKESIGEKLEIMGLMAGVQ